MLEKGYRHQVSLDIKSGEISRDQQKQHTVYAFFKFNDLCTSGQREFKCFEYGVVDQEE